jgi:hypothetical protein
MATSGYFVGIQSCFLASGGVLPATISSSLISGFGVNSVVPKKIFRLSVNRNYCGKKMRILS